MDGDFKRQLTAIINGELRDDTRARELLLHARTAVEAKQDAVDEMRNLLLTAQEAFLLGWADLPLDSQPRDGAAA